MADKKLIAHMMRCLVNPQCRVIRKRDGWTVVHAKGCPNDMTKPENHPR